MSTTWPGGFAERQSMSSRRPRSQRKVTERAAIAPPTAAMVLRIDDLRFGASIRPYHLKARRVTAGCQGCANKLYIIVAERIMR